MVESPSTRRGPAGPPWLRKTFLIVAGALSLALAAGSGLAVYGIVYFNNQFTRISLPAVENNNAKQKCSNHPCTFLILGSDSRKGLTKKEQKRIGTGPAAVQGQRADTIILVNVNAAKDRTVVVHIPRDLLVDIPGHGMNKINSAFQYGPNTMVRTVERLTGLNINHYVQINFAGFEKLVNALGGVDLCVNKPMIDPLAGLKLRHAGCYHMNGRTALAFVRARHVQGDVIPDFSRIARQQQFMRAIIDKLLSAKEVLTNFRGLVKAVQHNLILDKGLNLYELQDLTRRLAGLGQRRVLFRVVPAVPQALNGVDYVVATPEARVLFARLREDRSVGNLGKEQVSTLLSPAAVSVRVYDAGGGAAVTDVVSYLQHAGFDVVGVSPAPSNLRQRSAIFYRNSTTAEQEVVSSYLPDWRGGRSAKVVTGSGADVVVVVAKDSPGIPQ